MSTVVFLGDSITEGAPWAHEFGPEAVNQGVGGDRTYMVAGRLAETVRANPSAVVLLVGINDLLGDGAPPERVSAAVRELLVVIGRACPGASLLVQSIYPVRLAGSVSPSLASEARRAILETNRLIAKAAAELRATYVDTHAALVGPDGDLRPEYTDDGLHLTPAGYAATLPPLRAALTPLP